MFGLLLAVEAVQVLPDSQSYQIERVYGQKGRKR